MSNKTNDLVVLTKDGAIPAPALGEHKQNNINIYIYS